MMLTRRILPAARLLVCLSLICAVLFGQSERGTISGTAKDATGAVVPGAKVVANETQTNVTINSATNDAGDYTIANVPVGIYTIRVEKAGFRPALLSGLTVDAATSVRADVTLEVGASTQAIEVQATAVQLHTEDSKSSVTISNKLVDELPLVVGGTVRSPFDLAVLTPEAKNLGGDAGFALGGGQAAGYGTTLDGISADTSRALQKSWVSSNSPSVEAITEFTVDTNGFKAEFSHAAGGVMQFVTKSGTNQLHGSAYEFIRNTEIPISTPTIGSVTAPARPGRFISRMTSALPSEVPSTFPRSTTAKTRPFSSFPTRDSGIGMERQMSPRPCRPRKCTTATSANG